MTKKMTVITGGAGFIGSCLLKELNNQGFDQIIIVDSLGKNEKWKNLRNKKYIDFIHKDQFLPMIKNNAISPQSLNAIFHLGACSKTTEKDADYLMQNNTHYTLELASFAIQNSIPFFYASSAATYGSGENGYRDDESAIFDLKPQNMYGYSKQLFDEWAHQKGWLKKITGFKFFNVFGPNEQHKTGMTSIVFNSFHQIQHRGMMKLFKSDHPDYKDGEQLRDFVYVKDVVKIMAKFLEHPEWTGLYNIGHGETTTWKAMTEYVFKAMDQKPNITYIDMPSELKGKYQYKTLADMNKTLTLFPYVFTPMKDCVTDYVQNHLIPDELW